MHTLRQRGHKQLRHVHNGVLANMSLQGSQLSDIAQRAGVTRQAVGQIVDDLIALGYVTRVADPDDGRSRLIKYTKRGQHLLDDGLAVIEAIEDELQGLLGERGLLALKRSLQKIVEHYRLDDAMP